MYYAGLDLHKRYFTLCVLTSAGEVVLDHRRLPADLEPLQSILRELGGPVTVTIEATLQWAWLHDRLTQAGFPVCVAHPQQVKLISHARCKTDPIDARKLAELTRGNLLPTIWVPPPEVRAWRQLVRARATLVRLRTRAKNRIHACLAAENCRVPATDLFGWGGRAWLSAVALPPEVRREIQVQLALITALEEQLRGYDGEVKRLAAHEPAARLLQTIPGVGPFGALLLLAEIGSISRFASSRELAAYAGLVPSTRSSGGKTAHGSVARAGSGWLKWILIEAVQTHKQVPGPVRCHYERLLRAKGKPKATVAAARKLCTYIYWMLREQRPYPEWLTQQETRRAGRPMQRMASSA
jgi:transposase